MIGFALGYGTSKALRLSDADVRALTIKVVIKNSGLAYDVLRGQIAALAPLIFGTWLNIAASSLASFWSQRNPRINEPNEIESNI